MDSNTLTRIHQVREQYAYFQRQQTGAHTANPYALADAPVLQYFQRKQILLPPVLPTLPVLNEEGNCSAVVAAVAAVKAFLSWLAGSGLGPTHVARRIYMVSVLIAAAWNWVAPTGIRRITETRDGWDWDAGIPFASANHRAIWFTHIFGQHIGGIVGAGQINMEPLYELERVGMRWTREEQGEVAAGVLAAGGATAFGTAWNAWLASRLADGSASLPTPGLTELVNKDLQLETASGVLPSFADASKWTPLKLPMKPSKQGYLTFFWGTVRSTGLSSEHEGDLFAAAGAFFPDETERAAEVAEVVGITAGLTDREKCTAEWWAGGPGTIAPPGMCVWWWKEYMEAVGAGEDVCMYSLLDLGIHLFEASRLVWGLKAVYAQARPIQEIRRRYAGETLIGYDGLAVSGELWMPFQEVDFVTPPFADFPSGHSCFSQMGATVMTTWFGAEIPTVGRRRTDLKLMSPMWAVGEGGEGAFNQVVIPAGRSRTQIGAVPAADVALEWNTWQELANSSGMSRLYGGIHCISAHTSSQHVATVAHTFLDEVWGIRR
jgi:hypothetical protein